MRTLLYKMSHFEEIAFTCSCNMAQNLSNDADRPISCRHFSINTCRNSRFSAKKYHDFETKTDKNRYICMNKDKQANITQLVERNLPKVEVAGSSPVVRSSSLFYFRTDFFYCIGREPDTENEKHIIFRVLAFIVNI